MTTESQSLIEGNQTLLFFPTSNSHFIWKEKLCHYNISNGKLHKNPKIEGLFPPAIIIQHTSASTVWSSEQATKSNFLLSILLDIPWKACICFSLKLSNCDCHCQHNMAEEEYGFHISKLNMPPGD